jgi:hypothetical protein
VLLAAGLALSRTLDRGPADAQREQVARDITDPRTLRPAGKVRTGRRDRILGGKERDASAAAELEAGSAPRRGARCWPPSSASQISLRMVRHG